MPPAPQTAARANLLAGLNGIFVSAMLTGAPAHRIVQGSGSLLMYRALLLSALSLTALHAQTTFATITGTVSDPTGLPVPNAMAEAVHRESGYKYQSRTNETGVYTLPGLREGAYDVSIAAAGFKDAQVKNVELVSRDIRRLDVKLELGQVAASVEVRGGGATLIETESSRISQTRSVYELEALPLNTRSLTAFLSLSPGVGTASTVTATRRFARTPRNQPDA